MNIKKKEGKEKKKQNLNEKELKMHSFTSKIVLEKYFLKEKLISRNGELVKQLAIDLLLVATEEVKLGNKKTKERAVKRLMKQTFNDYLRQNSLFPSPPPPPHDKKI